MTGTVITYGRKGFGWVDADGRSIFVHIQDVKGQAVLHAGETVEFDLVHGPKGLRALNVRVLPATIESSNGYNR
jgi:CspA family cold shock protein